MVTTGTCIVAGEITTSTYVDVPRIARGTIDYVGYNDATFGFDSHTCGVHNLIQSQSPDISMGVDTGGAGDQGLMFGFACDETVELMPLPIMMAHKLVQRLSTARREGVLNFLRPDGKSQVSVEYVGNKPVRIEAVVISTQHSPEVSTEELRREVKKHIIDAVIPSNMVDSETKYHINPTGERFVVGGPHGDTGLTGRKIIVDTYGGMGRHGGSAFSGKDPTQGRSLGVLYGALYCLRTSWRQKLASRCEVQLAYAIGVAEPVSVMVDTFGTGLIADERFTQLVRENFILTPRGIIDTLQTTPPDLSQDGRFRSFPDAPRIASHGKRWIRRRR